MHSMFIKKPQYQVDIDKAKSRLIDAQNSLRTLQFEIGLRRKVIDSQLTDLNQKIREVEARLREMGEPHDYNDQRALLLYYEREAILSDAQKHKKETLQNLLNPFIIIRKADWAPLFAKSRELYNELHSLEGREMDAEQQIKKLKRELETLAHYHFRLDGKGLKPLPPGFEKSNVYYDFKRIFLMFGKIFSFKDYNLDGDFNLEDPSNVNILMPTLARDEFYQAKRAINFLVDSCGCVMEEINPSQENRFSYGTIRITIPYEKFETIEAGLSLLEPLPPQPYEIRAAC